MIPTRYAFLMAVILYRDVNPQSQDLYLIPYVHVRYLPSHFELSQKAFWIVQSMLC